MPDCAITPAKLGALRERVREEMSAERFCHVLAVEQTAKEMAELYCPQDVDVVCAAALLHDVTKELSTEQHLAILRDYDIEPTKDMISAPATLHAVTAALVIPERYPELCDEDIISAVRYHTTGRADMTLIEKIIYLADYIEPTRKYEGCKRLRNLFFGTQPQNMSDVDRARHLDEVILESLELTLEHLKDKNGAISSDTKKAREYLARQLKDKTNGEK